MPKTNKLKIYIQIVASVTLVLGLVLGAYGYWLVPDRFDDYPSHPRTAFAAGVERDFEENIRWGYNCNTGSNMATGGLLNGSNTGRAQANPALEGNIHLVSGQLTSTNNFWLSPPILVDSTTQWSFLHKISNNSSPNSFLNVELLDAYTQVQVAQLDTYTYTGTDGGVSQSLSGTFGQDGVFRLRIRFGGNSGQARGAMDDIVVGGLQYTRGGVGTIADPITGTGCDPAPFTTGDTDSTPFETPIIVDVLGNDQAFNYTLQSTDIDIDTIIPGQQNVISTPEGAWQLTTLGVQFIPASGFSGTAALPYQVVDDTNAISNISIIEIEVQAQVSTGPETGTTTTDTSTTTDTTSTDSTSTTATSDPSQDISGAQLVTLPRTGSMYQKSILYVFAGFFVIISAMCWIKVMSMS